MDAEAFVKVKILYFGSVRAAIGKSEEYMEIAPDITVHRLLEKLAGIYGEGLREEIFDGDGASLRDDLMITLNEAVIAREKLAGTGLKQGDNLALYPIFPGGG